MRLRAAGWTFVDLLLRQGVTFAVSLVLARLVDPRGFGLVAVSTALSAFGIALIQTTATTLIVQRSESSREEETALFWSMMVATFSLALIVAAASEPVAAFYGEGLLQPLLWVAAAQMLASSFAVIPIGLLTRSLNVRPLAAATVWASAISGIVTLSMAFYYSGFWALALQPLIFTVVNSTYLWTRVSWRPSLAFHLNSIRWMFRPGSHLAASSFLDISFSQGFALIVGKFQGARELGLFNRAQGTQQLPGNIISAAVTRVALPILVEARNDAEQLKRALRFLSRSSMALNLPVMACLVVAPDLVLHVLFGPVWVEAQNLLRILAVAGALFPLHAINVQLLVAMDETKRLLTVTTYKQVTGIICIMAGILAFGVTGVALGYSLYSVFAFFLNAHATSKLVRYGASRQLLELRECATAVAIMMVSMALVRSTLSWGPGSELVILLLVGCTVYAVATMALNPRIVAEGLSRLRAALLKP